MDYCLSETPSSQRSAKVILRSRKPSESQPGSQPGSQEPQKTESLRGNHEPQNSIESLPDNREQPLQVRADQALSQVPNLNFTYLFMVKTLC